MFTPALAQPKAHPSQKNWRMKQEETYTIQRKSDRVILIINSHRSNGKLTTQAGGRHNLYIAIDMLLPHSYAQVCCPVIQQDVRYNLKSHSKRPYHNDHGIIGSSPSTGTNRRTMRTSDRSRGRSSSKCRMCSMRTGTRPSMKA